MSRITCISLFVSLFSLMSGVVAVVLSPPCLNFMGMSGVLFGVMVCFGGLYLCLVVVLIRLGVKLVVFVYVTMLTIKSFLEVWVGRTVLMWVVTEIVMVCGISIVCGVIDWGCLKFLLMKLGRFLFGGTLFCLVGETLAMFLLGVLFLLFLGIILLFKG